MIGEELVANAELIVFYDVEVVADHEVIDLSDGTVGAVLDRQHAVFAET